MKKNQQGATLIVVLILLVIMTIIGTLAVRNSLTSLNIATNSQAQQLLIQNSDSAIFNVENPSFLIRNLAYDGLFGLIKSDVNKGKELVFCYKGAQIQFFNLSQASLMQWVSGTSPSGTELGGDGYCKLGDSTNFFTSGRKAVMTQVSIKVNTNTEDVISGIENPFSFMQQGTDTESAKIDKSEKILVTATSIVPALSTASDEDINDCFSKHMNQVTIPSTVTPATGMDKSVSQCLQGLGVPVNTQITEYNLTQAFERT
ncbi:pilus assembly protein PilX [Acinetobacter sp. TTH0-4]|uniref:PilX N-terminal domain-containing pilus assembly protein n=1 Tax=Acinetobacter sp. TTH0-4 TaxID=1646498 RepID=UPI0006AF3DE8|nr:PilX N-terminal domain-containing pilus assembly protein [Acinetobacter sp. TTH0-4]ALD02628.1 pilus assembly protein PilX [Acinetobacter sp. TTH0-4]